MKQELQLTAVQTGGDFWVVQRSSDKRNKLERERRHNDQLAQTEEGCQEVFLGFGVGEG